MAEAAPLLAAIVAGDRSAQPPLDRMLAQLVALAPVGPTTGPPAMAPDVRAASQMITALAHDVDERRATVDERIDAVRATARGCADVEALITALGPAHFGPDWDAVPRWYQVRGAPGSSASWRVTWPASAGAAPR